MKQTATGPPRLGRQFFEQEMVQTELHPFADAAAAVFSTRCPGKESVCEDSAALIPFSADSGVLVVADGLGGLPAGSQASSLSIERLEWAMAEGLTQGVELRDAILNGFEEANRAVCEQLPGAATTLAVVEVQGRMIRPYHVGDSTILVVGQRGRLKLQTVSHSPVGYAVEAGFLDREEAMHHEERHLISNMIGSPDMHITIGAPLVLSDRDTLLLASDGLSDNLYRHEIVERIRKGPIRKVADRLQRDALERMIGMSNDRPSKPDDLTFIVYRPVVARCQLART